MSYNTTIVFINDSFYDIKIDREFGNSVYEAVLKYKEGEIVNIPSGGFKNAGQIVSCQNSNETCLIAVGENSGSVLSKCIGNKVDYKSQRGKEKILKSLAKELGFSVFKKSRREK